MSNARRIMLLANNLLFWTRAEVARGATMAAARFGASIRCLDWYGSAAREKEYLASLLDSPPDGILFLCPFETKNLALCQELATRVPAVQIMVPHGDLCCDRVMMNNVAGASHAMDHLIRLGYRRIGHVTFNVDWT
ncbi:MAG: hypothetical protein O3A46_13235, partial [Candidatus Poribacteria bacterium]|nr:hypothetical protein [Candidatus Poribacteria bacterium]